MRKLIHSDFELDLSTFKISDTEDNSWFSDTFFTKYSFPFEIDIEKDLEIAFGFISYYNSANIKTYFPVKYQHGNKIEDAIFEIDQMIEKISCTIRFGFESLPSFDKKLNQLSLEKFTLPSGVTLYQHANTIVNLSWPAVNYNFPQVHTDRFNVDDVIWTYFKRIINNRINGVFTENEFSIADQVHYIRNIMQPLPTLLHILQRGMIDGGFILAGSILNDSVIVQTHIFANIDHKPNNIADIQNAISFNLADYDSIDSSNGSNANPRIWLKYDRAQSITIPGYYKIIGYYESFSGYAYYENSIDVFLNGVLLYHRHNTELFTDGSILFWEIDVPFEIFAGTNTITVHAEQYVDNLNDRPLCDISIVLVSIRDASNNLLPAIYDAPEIDLTKVVPDMTFLELIKMVKNWFNYDITKVVGNTIYMDLVESNINGNNIADFRDTEVRRPIRKFNQGISYLLKFSAIDSTLYTYLPVFHNILGVQTTNYVTDEKTKPIEINALPLPLLLREGSLTAHAFENNESKPYIVVYNRLDANSKNLSRSIYNYLLPNLYPINWFKWIDFRINSQPFGWTFKCFYEKIKNLDTKTKIYAYNNVHIIKSINKTEIEPDQFEVDIETESFK